MAGRLIASGLTQQYCKDTGKVGLASSKTMPRLKRYIFLICSLDSSRLESALSLQPTAEQRAFERRKDYDLVVIYDAASKAFPAKGAFATAPSTLFSIIFEKEFSSSKTLARSPVLLVGGYEAWSDERLKRAPNGVGSANGYSQVSKGPPPALP
jgi:hypothetical protein